MKNRMRVLMVGPLIRTGGVANHTKFLIKSMDNKDLDLLVYNSSLEKKDLKIITNIKKIYRRSIGLIWFSIKKRRSFEIVHTQVAGGLPSFLTAITGVMISLILNKKLIVTFHYSETREFVNNYKKIVGFVFYRTNRLILVSNFQKEVFIENFSNTNKVRVIPNGYQPQLFKPIDMSLARKELGLPDRKKILVNIANLEEYKGQKYLIEAMKNILAKRDDVILYIVGRGSLKIPLQLMINKYGIRSNVILAGGNKPAEEIPLWINACDIFILPSLNEGNPTVMFECMACGKPFVGTRVGGIPEIITNRKLGYIVEPKDVDGLANKILEAIGEDWDKEFILNYAGQFTWDEIAKRVERIYSEVTDKY